MLEGEFEMTDKVKCPSCETSFVPEKVLASQTNATTLKTESEIIPDDSSAKSSSSRSSNAPNSALHTDRPKQIVWAVEFWMGTLIIRNLILLLYLVVGAAKKDMFLFEAQIGPFIGGTIALPFTVFVAWKLFKGKNWARIVYTIVAPLALLQESFYAFAAMAMSSDPLARKDSALLADWVITVNFIWCIALIFSSICVLWWINRQESVAWFRRTKANRHDCAWWAWVCLGILLCDAFALLIGGSCSASSGTEKGVRNSHTMATTTTTIPSQKKLLTQQHKNKQPSNTLDDDFHSFVLSNQSSIGLVALHTRCERIHRLRSRYWAIREHGVSLNTDQFDADKWYKERFVAKDFWIPTPLSERQLTGMENRVAEMEKKILKNEGKLPVGEPLTEIDREVIANEIAFEKQIRKEFRENALKVFDLLRRYQSFQDRDVSFEQSLVDRPELWGGGEVFLSFSELVNERQTNSQSVQMSRERHIILPNDCILSMIHCPQIRPGFYVGKFEVTREQWGGITGTIPGGSYLDPTHPVSDVSMRDIEAFLRALNRKTAPQGLTFRLPTREEWMQACAAGSKGRFGQIAKGFEGELFEMGWYKNNTSPSYKPHHVGEKEPNVWGLYDMHGNVWERTKELTDIDNGSKKQIAWTSIYQVLQTSNCQNNAFDWSLLHFTSNTKRQRSARTVADNRGSQMRSRTNPGFGPLRYKSRSPRKTEVAPFRNINDPWENVRDSQTQEISDNSISIIHSHGWKTIDNQIDSHTKEAGVAGGSFKSPESECFLSSYYQLSVDFTGEDVGFRLVAERIERPKDYSHPKESTTEF